MVWEGGKGIYYKKYAEGISHRVSQRRAGMNLAGAGLQIGL